MMKTTFKFLFALVIAVAMFSCTGGNKNGNQSQNKTTEKEVVQQDIDIAKLIWEKLIVENPDIKKTIEEAASYESERNTEPELRYPSKTSMVFCKFGDESEGQIDQLVYYQMQCYMMDDQSWIAVIYDNCIDEYSDDRYHSELSCFHYKDGELLNDNPQVDLPAECPQSVMLYYNTYFPWRNCAFNFDDTGFEMIPYKFWPIRYEWTGERFVMNADASVVSNDFLQGDLGPFDFSRTNKNPLNFYEFKVDPNYLFTYGITGEEVLQLEFEDDKLSVINILSPKVGIAFAADMFTRPYADYYLYYYTSKPVAIGQPIRNVIDSEKYEDLHKEITESSKDGLYTITQHIKVDKVNHKDIYAEYQAKDKDSKIEKFRIVGLPMAITLESELDENQRISDEAKQLWKLINADNAVTKNIPGVFKNIWDADKVGFDAIYRDEFDNGGYVDWKLTYAMLTANDGRQIAYVRKSYYDRRSAEMPELISPEWEQYVYQDGNLQKVEPQIPEPQLTDFPAYNLGDKTVTMDGEEADIYFRCNGTFRFLAHSDHYQSFGEEAPDAWTLFYMINYRWDGEKFVIEE